MFVSPLLQGFQGHGQIISGDRIVVPEIFRGAVCFIGHIRPGFAFGNGGTLVDRQLVGRHFDGDGFGAYGCAEKNRFFNDRIC
jgi:hypothetical protein